MNKAVIARSAPLATNVASEPRRVLSSSAESRVEVVPERIYVIHVLGHLVPTLIEKALDVIWASPGWRQPYGLVVVMQDDTTHDNKILATPPPPDRKRAVGTSLASPNQLHRMVIQSVGITYKLVSKFVLTAHEDELDAILRQRDAIAAAEREGRAF